MTRNSFMVLLALVLCFAILVTEGRSTQQTRAVGQKLPHVDENDEASADDTDEFRFLTGGGTGGSNSVAINNLITQKQQLLESLRPSGGTGTSTGAANVIYVNAGASTTGTGGTTGAAASNSGSSVAGLLLPQVIGAALQGGNTRRRRRPSNRRRNRNRNRNRGQNRNRNRKHRRPQVYLVRP